MENNSNRFQELDALRGIAALIVVLFHFTMDREAANLGFKIGITGVDLFFIISGFVIYMSLTKVKTSKDFIINRVSRLYPTYWVCVTIATLVALPLVNTVYQYDKIPLSQYVANMTMFQHYFKIRNIDGPYWTMIVEMVFYIGILLLFHFKLIKYLKLIGLILVISIVTLTNFFYNDFVAGLLYWVPVLQFIPLFFAGTIFYKMYTENSKNFNNYLVLVICLIGQILLFHYSGKSKGSINLGKYIVMLIIYFSLFTFFINDKLKFIISKPSLFLGKISFALYLIHQKIGYNIIIPFLADRHHVNFWIALTFALIVVVILATIITYYIEIPLSKKMKKKLSTIGTKKFAC